jgi:2-keto-4-pentenoate hydratase/2-oxohepta-3-ene-1,7-dioic acid hydratase in catechol pathway
VKIIRFLDEAGQVRYGSPLSTDGVAEVLEGELFAGLRRSGAQARIARLLAPFDPVNIFCLGLNPRAHAQEAGAPGPIGRHGT